MLDDLRRWIAGVRASRLQATIGLGLLLALAVPAQALVRHAGSRTGARARSTHAGAKCNVSWYEPKSDASDLSGRQANQLDLVKGTFGLDRSDHTLRVVVNVKNLSKKIPSPANYMDYLVYWTNPSGDKGPNAVDATVSSSGKVTFSDGTVTVVNGNTQYTANASSSAKGKFGHGRNGAIEWDVALKAMKLKAGQTLSHPFGQSADGASSPAGSLGGVSDNDPGKNYKLDQRTCIDKTG